MRRKPVQLAPGALALALALTLPLAAQEFAIDPAHSDVGFQVRHMVVSKVRGTFTELAGTVVLDAAHPEKSSVEVIIDASGIDTRNAQRDTHLKSRDFFEVATYPEIRFTSVDVRRDGNRWTATGDLAMHGRTRRVELVFRLNGPITDPWGNQRLGIEVDPIVLDRREFGLSWAKLLDNGGLVVGNDITVTINLEAVSRKATVTQ
ncbi:MAG: YceI family protein [Acidobacteria bacterium]|nr:YceI family protein [Acidobacteriota bacterium]